MSKIALAKSKLAANQTKILIGALAVTTTAAVLFKTGLNQHNEFLKAHDLYDTFYTVV